MMYNLSCWSLNIFKNSDIFLQMWRPCLQTLFKKWPDTCFLYNEKILLIYSSDVSLDHPKIDLAFAATSTHCVRGFKFFFQSGFQDLFLSCFHPVLPQNIFQMTSHVCLPSDVHVYVCEERNKTNVKMLHYVTKHLKLITDYKTSLTVAVVEFIDTCRLIMLLWRGYRGSGVDSARKMCFWRSCSSA